MRKHSRPSFFMKKWRLISCAYETNTPTIMMQSKENRFIIAVRFWVIRKEYLIVQRVLPIGGYILVVCLPKFDHQPCIQNTGRIRWFLSKKLLYQCPDLGGGGWDCGHLSKSAVVNFFFIRPVFKIANKVLVYNFFW